MTTINPACPPTQQEIVAARLFNDVFVFSAFAVAASASMTVAFGRGFGSVSMNHVVGWVSGVVLLVYALELVLRLLGRADYSEITSARGI